MVAAIEYKLTPLLLPDGVPRFGAESEVGGGFDAGSGPCELS